MTLNSPGKIAFFAIILFIGAYAAGYYGRPPTTMIVPTEQVLQPAPEEETPSTQTTPKTVEPLSVVEDSRCPVNANCIWAGTVRVNAKVTVGPQSLETIFTLGETKSVLGKTITLTEVLPQKTTGEILFAQYTFSFDVK